MIDAPRRSHPRPRGAMLAALVSAATLALVQPAAACTSFLLPTSDGSSVYGRTMEFGFEVDWR